MSDLALRNRTSSNYFVHTADKIVVISLKRLAHYVETYVTSIITVKVSIVLMSQVSNVSTS
jgi:hypothetical protein